MPAPSSSEQEVLDRVRRIESRLTALTRKLGYTTPAAKPQWFPRDRAQSGAVVVPSREIALDEILAAIPDHYTGDVMVWFGGWETGRVLCHITKK